MVLALFCLTFVITSSNPAHADQPKIFSKGDDLHIQSGDNGNIVFHPSQGKVFLGSHELNFTNSAGLPGAKGDRGDKGDTGNTGPPGPQGSKGSSGEPGVPGFHGEKGEPGNKGMKGDDGLRGSSGAPGPQGRPGPRGPEINVGPSIYYTGLSDGPNEKCNSSTMGTVRFNALKSLQLCTLVGWVNIVLESNPPRCTEVNIPERNLKAFYKGDPGILFQFNNDTTPMTYPSSYNASIKAELVSTNSTSKKYVDAVMRQALYFSGKRYVNVSGIPVDFWRNRDWSVTALLKVSDSSVSRQFDMPVLGVGNDTSEGLHLGIRKSRGRSSFEVFFEYKTSYRIAYGSLETNKWYHIAWTSVRTSADEVKRCVMIDGGGRHKCDKHSERYMGSGDTTIGSWSSDASPNDLFVDHLIISSSVVDYGSPDKQLCFAKFADKSLP